uniref:Ferrous iron transport protein B n=1 Tax=Ganoderma boninense TaxID=34458 RepID=A0A5K1K5N2_9APHY|nr:Ferrous iron transport protein B [Ganoderma boninense]
MSTTQRPLQPLAATLWDARDECDELYDTVASAVAYQIASDVASFTMVVGTMSKTREELNRLLDEVIREIEQYDLVTEDTVQTEGWIRDLRTSIGRCPEDYVMLPYFAHQTGSLIARLTERRSRADMRTLA